MINIKVVGPGCSNCYKLELLCKQAIQEKQMEAEIEKVTEMDRFLELGIYMTPGLIINNKVVSSGKIPGKDTIKKWLADAS